jgi:TolB-like protein
VPAPDETGRAARSIAVLRFENLTGSPEENYFCAGITEDLLTEIMQIPDLKVASRTIVEALGKGPVDLKRAARTLGVSTILEGGVRRAGGRVRVTARLVSTEDGYPIWAGRYDRSIEDIFDVQEEIARQIAEALRVAFEPRGDDERLGRRTKSARAYDLRLQALALSKKWVEADMRRAIALLEEALREDPAYSLALADLAECRVQLYCKGWDLRRELLDRAEEEAGRARDSAPMLPEAYRAMGHVWNHRRRPDRAIREFHHAVDLDPRFTSALTQLANVYVFLGDPTRAEVYVRRAMGLEPEDPFAIVTLARILRRQGRYAESREAARSVVALHPSPTTLYQAYGDLVLASILDGTREAVERVDTEIRECDGRGSPAFLALSALTSAYLGRANEARGLLADPSVASSTISDAQVFAARAYLILDERELALKALERVATLDYIDLRGLATDPQLAPLRSDPRFEQILRPTQ